MRRFLAVAVLGLVSVAGCAEEETPSGIQTAESKMRPLVDAACDWMFGCCGPDELTYQLGVFTVDAGNCSERIIESIKAGNPLDIQQSGLSNEEADGLLALALSINEGRVGVNSPAVAACADATSIRACNVPVEVTPGGRCTPGAEEPIDPCDPEEMFVGRQGVGEECDGFWECKEGLRCIDFLNSGVCAETAVEGEFCYSDFECTEGLVCDYGAGLCTPGASSGEPCAFLDPTRPVPGSETIRCAAGLSCDSTTDTCSGGDCSPGAPCGDISSDSDCPEGFYCVVNEAGGATCRTPVAPGDYCNKDLDCSTGYCDPFASTCGNRLANGVICDFSEECQSAFCDFNTSTCAPTVGAGQPCPSFSDEECSGGYCNTDDPAAPVCDAYAGEGQPCPLGFECDAEQGLSCADGTCRLTPFPNGTTCFDSFQCESQVCFADECGPGAAFGAACSNDGMLEPCMLGGFCDISPGETMGTCTELRRSGEACERTEQCWGECVVRYGQFMCDATPAFLLDELWCDGNG